MFVRIQDSFLLNVMTTLYKEECLNETGGYLWKRWNR